MLAFNAPTPVHPAVVARIDPQLESERYLLVRPSGPAIWVADPEAATAFDSMREATRMAMRLPARQRAFGLPRGAELDFHNTH